MNRDTLSTLPDWPALMDQETAILYLGGSRASLERLEATGFLRRWQNGHRAVRFLRKEVDAALTAVSLAEREAEERKEGRRAR